MDEHPIRDTPSPPARQLIEYDLKGYHNMAFLPLATGFQFSEQMTIMTSLSLSLRRLENNPRYATRVCKRVHPLRYNQDVSSATILKGLGNGEKRPLHVDLDELCSAMEDSSYEHDYYLDLKTGEIVLVSDWMDEEESDRLRDRIDRKSDRYEQIPKVESYEAYEDMEDFIATV